MRKIKELFGIDIRSLALFRIALAIVLLGDLIVRMQDLRVFYSDEGLLPGDIVHGSLVDSWQLSLHLLSGSVYYQMLLFGLQFLFGVALLVGYQTRLATVLSWIMAVSLQVRNPLVNQGADDVLKLLLFWSMFLPLGIYWSLDRKRNPSQSYDVQILSMGTVALLLQICFIYWFSALLKTDPIWRVDGTAVWYALSFEQSATELGTWLLQYPDFLRFLTFATLYLEAFGPFFAFSPVWTGPLRMMTVIAFITFHLVGLNLTMELAHFPYICAAAWLVFIPTWFWDKILVRETGITWHSSWLSNVIAAFVLVFVFFTNVKTLGVNVPLNKTLVRLSYAVGIDQFWTMFAPHPLTLDGWYVMAGTLKDGTDIDLFQDGKPLSWEKPQFVTKMYKNDRWRTYLMTLTEEHAEAQLAPYAEYLCREWNQTHSGDQQLSYLTIYFMGEYIAYNQPRIAEPIILWEHTCD